MGKHTPKRRHEYADPTPTTAAVQFKTPPTLAEQIARYMGQHHRWQAQQGIETPEEAEDLDIDEDDSPESPHELVYDEQINREIPRYEKMLLDEQRKKFDQVIEEKRKADLAARRAAEAAEKRYRAQRKKNADKDESADADDDQD